MKKFAIKISTGENCPLDSFEEVQEVINLRHAIIESNGRNTIPLRITEGGAVAHIFPQFIIGYVEFHGTPLSEIVQAETDVNEMPETFYETMAVAAEKNLMES